MNANVRVIPKKIVTVIEPKRNLMVDKEKHRQLRVAAYCRVSTGSEEQMTSYTNQKKAYTELISQKKEWCLAGIYADQGLSGTQTKKRDEFNRMIEDCKKGKIDYIITKSVSRFARNTVDCLEYVRMLKAMGIGVLFEEQNIDTLKCDSELYLVIYAGFAQSESENISKNITWTFRKNFEEGKVTFMYKKLLGYKRGVDGEPEIVPEEAAVVKHIFEMFLSGKTVIEISEILQAENHTFVGKTFSFCKSMIISILSNEKYCGDAILQKTYTLDPIGKKRVRNDGELVPMYYVQNSHEAIISREMFNQAQAELARRKAKAPQSQKNALTATGRHSRYALTEVMMCGDCGSRYRRVTWSKKGKKKVVWRCINRLDYGTKYCKDGLTVEDETLKRAIVRALNRFNAENKETYLMLMKATIGDAIGLNGTTDEIDLLQRRIEALNKKMLEIVNESVQNGTDVEAHEDVFKSISEEIDGLTKRIDAIRKAQLDSESRADRLALLQETLDEREKHKFEYDDSIVRQMIECIKVYHDSHIEVIFGGGYTVEEALEPTEE